jgi:redox-sensitive bicupin YhaK (pirin superfamily)
LRRPEEEICPFVPWICGEFWGKRGPVEGVAADPRYLDVSVAPGGRKPLAADRSNHAFAYVFAGSGTFRDGSGPRGVRNELAEEAGVIDRGEAGNRSLILFPATRVQASAPSRT